MLKLEFITAGANSKTKWQCLNTFTLTVSLLIILAATPNQWLSKAYTIILRKQRCWDKNSALVLQHQERIRCGLFNELVIGTSPTERGQLYLFPGSRFAFATWKQTTPIFSHQKTPWMSSQSLKLPPLLFLPQLFLLQIFHLKICRTQTICAFPQLHK